MPTYDGENLLAQLNLMKDHTKVVTKRVIVESMDQRTNV